MRATFAVVVLGAMALGTFGCGPKEDPKDQGGYYTGPMKSKADAIKSPGADAKQPDSK